MRTWALASCSEFTSIFVPSALVTVNWDDTPFLPLLQLHIASTPFRLGAKKMIDYFDRVSPFVTVSLAQIVIHSSKVGKKRWRAVWGLASDTLLEQTASCNEAVRPVRIVVGDGEAWIIDSQCRYEFQIAVDSSPVARQRAAAQF